MLEEAEALRAIQRAPGGVVDDAEHDPAGDGLVGEVVGDALGEAGSLPLSVGPVGVTAVAAADVDRHGQQRLDLELEWLAVRRGAGARRAGRDAAAGGVADGDLWPAELLDAPVVPDPVAVVEGAVAVGVLLEDQHHGVLLEAERDVGPPHALERWV